MTRLLQGHLLSNMSLLLYHKINCMKKTIGLKSLPKRGWQIAQKKTTAFL